MEGEGGEREEKEEAEGNQGEGREREEKEEAEGNQGEGRREKKEVLTKRAKRKMADRTSESAIMKYIPIEF